MYRARQAPRVPPGTLADVHQGGNFRRLEAEGMFSQPEDMAFGLTFDGFQASRRVLSSCCPLVLSCMNLAPAMRVEFRWMTVAGLIPGPHEAKDFNSFLLPLLEEFLLLADGVPAYNCLTGSTFKMKAWIIMIHGDMPAIAKAISATGTGGLHPCRFCHVRGVLHRDKNTYYYPSSNPLTYPAGYKAERRTRDQELDLARLPLRTEGENGLLISTLLDLKARLPPKEAAKRCKDLGKETGFSGVSSLLLLPSVFPYSSFPIDSMHLLSCNLAKGLHHLLHQEFNQEDQEQPWCLDRREWARIGRDMAAVRWPSVWGQAPRDISLHSASFKAAEWRGFMLHTMVPLMTGRLPGPMVRSLGAFASALRRLLSRQPLREEELDGLERAMVEFVHFYERTFYRREYELLRVCTSNAHQLLHLVGCLRACGPLWTHSQWAMERLIGRLTRQVAANGAPYTALANRVLMQAQLADSGGVVLSPLRTLLPYCL
jgi:hypothetical protein